MCCIVSKGGSYNKASIIGVVVTREKTNPLALCVFQSVVRTVLDRDYPNDYITGKSRKALIESGRQTGTKVTARKTTKMS